MIPVATISEWSAQAPWPEDEWVEQDLIISRALVDLFNVEELADKLAFRGGTALHKLHLTPAARYSEDIDLVQMRAEPIGETLWAIQGVLNPWLGTPRRELKRSRVNLVYRFESGGANQVRSRLKIEINSREHFTVLGLVRKPFQVESSWFSGSASVNTFTTDELLATKLRALYQRKKGRDLFDLWYALERGAIDLSRLLPCFERYMHEGGHVVTRAMFEANLDEKRGDERFRQDITSILREGIDWDLDTALDMVLREIIAHFPGEPWKGHPERDAPA